MTKKQQDRKPPKITTALTSLLGMSFRKTGMNIKMGQDMKIYHEWLNGLLWELLFV